MRKDCNRRVALNHFEKGVSRYRRHHSNESVIENSCDRYTYTLLRRMHHNNTLHVASTKKVWSDNSMRGGQCTHTATQTHTQIVYIDSGRRVRTGVPNRSPHPSHKWPHTIVT